MYSRSILSTQIANSNSPTVKMVYHSLNLADLDFDLDDWGYLLNPDFVICLWEGERMVLPSNTVSDPFLSHLDPTLPLAIQIGLLPPCIIDQGDQESGETQCMATDDVAQEGRVVPLPNTVEENHTSSSIMTETVTYNETPNTFSYSSLSDLITPTEVVSPTFSSDYSVSLENHYFLLKFYESKFIIPCLGLPSGAAKLIKNMLFLLWLGSVEIPNFGLWRVYDELHS